MIRRSCYTNDDMMESYLKDWSHAEPDRILRCHDGIHLRVHFHLLKRKSGVLASMFKCDWMVPVNFESKPLIYVLEDIYMTPHKEKIGTDKDIFDRHCICLQIAEFFEFDYLVAEYTFNLKEFWILDEVSFDNFKSIMPLNPKTCEELDGYIARWIRDEGDGLLSGDVFNYHLFCFLDRDTSSESRRAWVNYMLNKYNTPDEISSLIVKVSRWDIMLDSLLNRLLSFYQDSFRFRPNKQICI